ncbi:MAG: FG-GAP-like repeat-containing protein [Saprospiraceae bacterium]|nr:FG-GAP-like repeat-containing protein [Saprospiraceae bacterium]
MPRFLFFLTLFLPDCLPAQVTFQQIPGLAFFDSQGYLNGVSWVDVDNDNDLDVCVSGAGGAFPNFTNISAIYLNNGNETFTAGNLLPSTQNNPMRHGWADYDNDGDLDLYIGATWNNNGINELWRNNGNGSMALVAGSGATPNVAQPYEGTVSWADYDNDGWADLFIPRWNDQKNKLYRNNGNGTFNDITNTAITNDLAWTSGGFWGDYDNDRDQDLFVVNYQIGSATPGNNDLFRNNGDGSFTKITNAGQVVSIQQNGRSANWADVNNDGFLDLFVCNQFGQDLLHLNNQDGTFTTRFIGATNHTSWSSNWGDYDNDGDLDLITIGFWGDDSRFWENDGLGNLSDVTAAHPNIFPTAISGSNSNGIIWVDYNRDGWLDLHLTQPDAVPDRFFENEKTTCRSWIEIKCIGNESNKAAIGATVRARSLRNGMPWWQMRQVSAQTAATGNNPLLLHFGFDNALLIDSLVVEWPSGQTCVFTNLMVNQIIDIQEDCSMVTTQASPALPGEKQVINLCLPLDSSYQLTPVSSPGGVWLTDCGDCIDEDGLVLTQFLPDGQYTFQYVNGNICDATVDSFVLNLLPSLVIVATGDTSVYAGEEVPLLASGGSIYDWQPSGSLNCSACPDPVFTADTTTLFVVQGSNEYGCVDVDSLTVTVLPELSFDMPNAFSPNGDGKNDVFKPVYEGEIFVDYRLRIYSRWGEEIFKAEIAGEGWDGTLAGKALPSDGYVFVFEYTIINGEKGRESGDVTLIR